MKIFFTKKVGYFEHRLKVIINIGTNIVTINEMVTENRVIAFYNNGEFNIDGEFKLGEKSFTKIKCPKNKIESVEEYINFKK